MRTRNGTAKRECDGYGDGDGDGECEWKRQLEIFVPNPNLIVTQTNCSACRLLPAVSPSLCWSLVFRSMFGLVLGFRIFMCLFFS